MAGGRRTSLASLAGAPVETVPGHNDPTLVRLPLPKLAPTPLNPRTNFGTPDQLTELGESLRKRQLQPVVVVSRASYLKLFPEHAEQAGDASHVIITGERRYRGARQVGLGTLSAVILEEIAASRQDILDAVLSENIDRKNFDPIEEALAVQAMVKECGKAAAAADRFRRTRGWVSQRLSLLRLAPEVQVLVRSGEIPVREARDLAGHPEHEQMAVWRQRALEREQPKPRSQDVTVADPPPGGPAPMVVPSSRATSAPELTATPGPAEVASAGVGHPGRGGSQDHGAGAAAVVRPVVPVQSAAGKAGDSAGDGGLVGAEVVVPKPAGGSGPSGGRPVWAGREQAWTAAPRWKDLVELGRRIAEDLALPERKRLAAYLAQLNTHEESGTFEPAADGEVAS